jgi:FKBP-type peptidyl-prolyl cis-trans isomerase FklB
MKILIFFLFFVTIVFSTNETGKKFLEENSKKEGVVVLPSGLQYKILSKGEGKQLNLKKKGAFHPKEDTPCDCHYAGRLIDGTEFDSSYKRGSPTSFAPNQVIRGNLKFKIGWTEAMQLMVEGDKWELYIPSELGYGESGSGQIKPGDALIFQMEIIKINGDKTPAIKCDATTKENCDEKEVKFIEQTKNWKGEAIKKELKRLVGMSSSSMQPGLQIWILKRVQILKTLSKDEL